MSKTYLKDHYERLKEVNTTAWSEMNSELAGKISPHGKSDGLQYVTRAVFDKDKKGQLTLHTLPWYVTTTLINYFGFSALDIEANRIPGLDEVSPAAHQPA